MPALQRGKDDLGNQLEVLQKCDILAGNALPFVCLAVLVARQKKTQRPTIASKSLSMLGNAW